MQHAIVELNRDWTESEIAIHVGLCTGPVAAGTIGTDSYLQYATIGDTTNVASRICGQAEAGEIVLAESTRACLPKDAWQLEALAPVTVKGKDEPLQLYRLLYD